VVVLVKTPKNKNNGFRIRLECHEFRPTPHTIGPATATLRAKGTIAASCTRTASSFTSTRPRFHICATFDYETNFIFHQPKETTSSAIKVCRNTLRIYPILYSASYSFPRV
jgi:hypothetical protein